MEEAAASLGASRFTIFRRVVFPHLLPALLSGIALAFARAIGEFGAVILISGNLPFKTEVASLYVFEHINSGDTSGAAALALLMLATSFLVLLGIGGLRRWTTRHDRPA
jgi:sulfate transport system permease protein